MRNLDDNLNKLWRYRYLAIIFFACLLAFGIIFFILTTKDDKEKYESIKQKYKLINTKDVVSAKITTIDCNKGASIISLTKGGEIIIPTSRNYDYEIFELCCFLNTNDSIQKKAGTDTMHVFREAQVFYFVLGEFIGEKYDSRFYKNPCR